MIKEKTDDENENRKANKFTATLKIEASDEDEVANAGTDEKSKTKSKSVIAEVHNSEAAKDEVSAGSFKSTEMSPAAERNPEEGHIQAS